MNKIIEVKFGSHLYGTNTPNSDLDFKGVYLPTAREIILSKSKKTISTTRPKQPFERNNKDDVDIEIFSLDRYLDLLLQGQTVALDLLFAPKSSYTLLTEQGEMLMDHVYMNRMELLNKNINAFVGYARQQAAKYGIKGSRIAAVRAILLLLDECDPHKKLKEYEEGFKARIYGNEFCNAMPELEEYASIVMCKGPNNRMEPHLQVCNRKIPFHASVKYAKEIFQKIFDEYGARALQAEKNEGIDWKALSHAVRVNSEAQELLETGVITFPRPDRELLLKIKLGELPYAEVADIIESGLQQLKVSQEKSILKEEPNREWAENFIYDVYSDIVRSGK